MKRRCKRGDVCRFLFGEKEEGDKTFTLQRGYAWFHLPHLSVSAQPTHLYVFAAISGSHLEKVAPHLLILIALYLPLPRPPSLSFLCLFPATVVTAIRSFLLWKRRAAALMENHISLKNRWVRLMWCVCMRLNLNLPSEHDSLWACPFVPEYIHTGSRPKYCRERQHLC